MIPSPVVVAVAVLVVGLVVVMVSPAALLISLSVLDLTSEATLLRCDLRVLLR